MPAQEFLDFMLMFLNGEPGAKAKMKTIITQIKKELSDYAIGSDNDGEEEKDIEQDYEEDTDLIDPPLATGKEHDDNEDQAGPLTDYELKMMSNNEIMKLIDAALDSSDNEEAKRLSKFLKESRGYDYH